ncbi:CtsR family transcriptional regulator [Halanaerobaculum tunisiense]
MSSLSDKIEDYLRKLLADHSVIKVCRSNLAQNFDCAPSQINYVLDTRFTQEKGYVIDSQRGGNGYIKITKVKLNSQKDLINHVYKQIGDKINQQTAFNIIDKLDETNLISSYEKNLFKTILHRRTLKLNVKQRDLVRARLLKGILKSLIRKEE